MRWSLHPRHAGPLATVVVVTVTLLAGSRLIALSLRDHSEVAHREAYALATSHAANLEPAFVRLAELADRAAHDLDTGDTGHASPSNTAPSAGRIFWMGSSDEVVGLGPAADLRAAHAIAAEFATAEATHALPAESFLGPVRVGSQWLLAVRAPASGTHGQSAVAYADLDALVASAHLTRLLDAGYDFELVQFEHSGVPRVFASSSLEPLPDPVFASVRLPMTVTPARSLQLGVRPKGGWVPFGLKATEIGLLGFLAWLLGFGTHDLVHALVRTRSSLKVSRRRVHALNERLAAEIEQRIRLQESVDHALLHDTFTGLPNRRAFMDGLDRALKDLRRRRQQRIAVILIDVVRLDLVNHVLGHTAGDELMVQAARRFERNPAARNGTLARWGGDEFALLVTDLDSSRDALRIASDLQHELHEPFQLRRHPLRVSAAIGVTCIESGQRSAEEVMREADVACSAARREDGGRVVLYAPGMAGATPQLVSLEADLHVALEKRQLGLLLQPIVDLRSGRMAGAEALLRWWHPVEGMLAPDRFLGIAEEAGLMVPITRWVIVRASELASDWRHKLPGEQTFYISVNLSPSALQDPGLHEHLATRLEGKGLPPQLLKFELTERALATDVSAAHDSLTRLHEMGFQLVLDNFGSGHSSLGHLQLFPFDAVKIDGPFVHQRDADESRMEIVAALVKIAQSLDLTAIAERVEDPLSATELEEMGCSYAQGYCFSEPLDADILLDRLRDPAPFRARAATTSVTST